MIVKHYHLLKTLYHHMQAKSKHYPLVDFNTIRKSFFRPAKISGITDHDFDILVR